MEELTQYNQFKITTMNGEYRVPAITVNAITALTNNEAETDELLGYLMDRISDFNNTITINSEVTMGETKFGFSPVFVRNLFVSLLSIGFSSTQIIEALEEFKDFELFGKLRTESGRYYDISLEERVEMIVDKVKTILGLVSDEEMSEENTYTNIDGDTTSLKRG